jgi:hypothetical protein
VSALDDGITLDDWAAYDRGGFTAAARNAIDADALMEMAVGMILNPVQPAYCAERWRTRMEAALAREVEAGRRWVSDWEHRFAKEDAA